tara:strand:+ start:73 stop:321 length:249 start_codon:yes stop_codon:yes gene_type:complete
MNDIIVYSASVSVIYFLLKFIEMRFILNEAKPVKTLVRDSITVCFSVIAGSFLIQQLAPAIGNMTADMTSTPVSAFTGEPGF